MGFLRRLFFSKSDLPALRKAMSAQRYADALLIAEELYEQELDEPQRAEVESLAAVAGDNLGRVNLDEGLYLLKEQQWERAREHLELAQQQAVSDELIDNIEQALRQLEVQQSDQVPPPMGDLPSECSSCSDTGTDETDSSAEQAPPDFEAQLELILTSYPDDLVPRYQSKSQEFKQAFVLGHQGQEVAALKLLGSLPAAEQDDLFDFEAGCLMARLGEGAKACDALYSALQQNPALELATEIMVSVLIGMEEYEKAVNFIQEMMAQDQDAPFCHAQLATVFYARNEADNTLKHAVKAIDGGYSDTNIVLMAAMLYESKEQFEKAETMYRRIPAPAKGCGAGSVNLYLAEFLLRQKRELRMVLDTFNNACRQEPENPRWQLRVAQTYLGLGWEKRGQKLLRMVVRDPNLMEGLRLEGESMLAE